MSTSLAANHTKVQDPVTQDKMLVFFITIKSVLVTRDMDGKAGPEKEEVANQSIRVSR